MKTTLFLCFLLVFLSGHKTLAQDSLRVVTPQQVTQTILEKLDHEVSLNNYQKTQVQKLLLERSEQFSHILKSGGAKKLTKADFKVANEQALSKLQAVLAPEQLTKLNALRQEEQRQKAAYKEADVYKSLQDFELDF